MVQTLRTLHTTNPKPYMVEAIYALALPDASGGGDGPSVQVLGFRGLGFTGLGFKDLGFKGFRLWV